MICLDIGLRELFSQGWKNLFFLLCYFAKPSTEQSKPLKLWVVVCFPSLGSSLCTEQPPRCLYMFISLLNHGFDLVKEKKWWEELTLNAFRVEKRSKTWIMWKTKPPSLPHGSDYTGRSRELSGRHMPALQSKNHQNKRKCFLCVCSGSW